MIILHHLRVGRSIFAVWLLEELGLEYELKVYHRHPETRRAPPELTRPHPLGKSPVIEDGDITLAESGAITAYLIETYTKPGSFAPKVGDKAARAQYLQWLHYPEGSAFMPIFVTQLSKRPGAAQDFIAQFMADEAKKQLDYMSAELGSKRYILGDELTGADFGLGFIVSMAASSGMTEPYPNLTAYAARIRERPAFKRALERGVE